MVGLRAERFVASLLALTSFESYNKRVSGFGGCTRLPKFPFGELQIHPNRYTLCRAENRIGEFHECKPCHILFILINGL